MRSTVKHLCFAFFLLFVGANFCFAQSPSIPAQNRNYTVSNKILVPGKTSESQLTTLTIQETAQSVEYFNGSGKPEQTVITKGSPSQKDVVSFRVYDSYGREATKYLSYGSIESNAMFKTALPSAEYYNFYNSSSSKVATDASPFANLIFETNPLNRPFKQGSPGAFWQPNTGASKSYSYASNTANEVKKWNILDLGSQKFSLNYVFYNSAELSLASTTDEQGLVTKVYKDFEGKTLCTKTQVNASVWAETHYVYDDRGDLRFVLPPQAINTIEQQMAASGDLPSSYVLVTQNTTFSANAFTPTTYLYLEGVTVTLTTGSTSFLPTINIKPFPRAATSTFLNQYAYQYLYDNLHRKIAEKTPGTDWKYFVYNNRDQLVLSQDGNQRLKNQYSFTKYDDLGRPVLSGLTTITGTIDQVRATVDGQTVLNEQIGNVVLGYTNNAYPNVSDPNAYLVATYYDDYLTCIPCQDTNFTFTTETGWVSSSNELFQKFDRVLGKTVGSSVKILGTNNWLNTVTYYNRNGLVIQTIGSNHLIGSNNLNGRDRVSSLYDFSGKKLEELVTRINYNSGGIATERKRFIYDHAGRVLTTYHQLNSQPEIILSAFEYNELGQVVKKRLHSDNGGATYLQALDYRYNIRGWLSNIDNIAPDFGDPVDYFGMDFSYNTSIANAGNTARADGLVSAIKWKNDLTTKQRLYNFSYDNLKQLSGAVHKMSTTGAIWGSESDFYNEAGITYDLNGNIQTLNRNTAYFNGASNVAEPIDQLTYNYGTGGNQLQFVKENIISSNKDKGFKDGGVNSTADPDYAYDANGNVTKDQNKGIVSITYYFNNLPKRATFADGSYIENTYDAAGIKLSTVYSKSGNTTTTDYVGGMVLLNGQVLLINHPEGRITAPTYSNLIVNKEAASLDGFTPSSASVVLSTASSGTQNYVVANTVSTTSPFGVYPIKTTQGNTYSVREGDTYTFSVLGYQTGVDYATLTNITNAAIDQGIAIYTSPTATNWGSGASSVERLPAGINGWAEFRPFVQEQAVGFSQNDVDQNWQSVQYGFFVTGTGASFTYSVVESGTTRTAPASLTTSDYLKVERIGSVIYYKKNGTVVYTSTVPSTTSLIVDMTLNKNAYSLFPKISFAKPTAGYEAGLYLNTNVGPPSELTGAYKLPNLYTNEGFTTITFTIPAGATSLTVGIKWDNGAILGSTAYINRLALYKTNFEYNYYLTDNVGSTRVVLQTAPATINYVATMETENQTDENAKFVNITATNISISPANTTPGGDEAIKLNAQNKIGPGKSLKVYPGDKINASAFSYYVSQGGFTKTANATIAGLLAPVFGGVAGAPGDPGSIYSNVGQAYSNASFAMSPDKGPNYPSAFINYILFDKDYNPIDGKSVAISSTPNLPQQVALPQVTVQELGYLFIYLSYDNDTGGDVFFDDLKLTVQESPVIQVNNYYPFGMQSYTWIREGETDNAYLFQGKELIAQTGWHDFGSRMYYGDLGRWFAADPQKQFGSPYMAMGNMPMMGRDPNGEFFWMPVIVGAFFGGFSSGAAAWAQHRDGDIFSSALKGAVMGGLSGVAGGFAPAGFLQGAAYGGITGAVLGATEAALNGGNVGRNALIGGAMGLITGGILGGIKAKLGGGNFWHARTIEEFEVIPTDIPSPVKTKSDNFIHQFAKKNFGAVPGRNGLGSITGQKVPKGYELSSNGTFIRKDATGKIINAGAVTTGSVNSRWSNVYMSPYSGKSFEEMYTTMGHEFIHVKNVFNIPYFQGFRKFTENAAYTWQFDESVKLNYTEGVNNATNGLLDNPISSPKFMIDPYFGYRNSWPDPYSDRFLWH